MRCNEPFFSRSHDAVIRVYDDADDVTATHEHIGFLARLLTLVETVSRILLARNWQLSLKKGRPEVVER